MELKDILDDHDELNLYLVSNGLRPAARLYVDPAIVRCCLDRSKTGVFRYSVKGVWNFMCMMRPDAIKEFKKKLDQMDVEYTSRFVTRVDAPNEKVKAFRIDIGYFYLIGKNQECLRALTQARTDREKGLALGYPEEAINTYFKVIDGELRDGIYVFNSLARARKAGIELPTWVAYIAFVPDVLDIVNGNISPISKEVGERYQRFVRKHNPDLAQRVEQEFKKFHESEEYSS